MHGGEENFDPPIREDQWIDLPTQQQTDDNQPVNTTIQIPNNHQYFRKNQMAVSLLSNRATTTISDYCTVPVGYQNKRIDD